MRTGGAGCVGLGWAAVVLGCVGGAAGFYLPGVAPKSYKMRENVSGPAAGVVLRAPTGVTA